MVTKWFTFLICYEAFDSIFQDIASFGFNSLITLIIFAILGSLFCDLMIFVREGKGGSLV